MSGGRFDYIQSRLQYEVIEELETIIKRNGKEMPIEDRSFWRDNEYYEKYPEEKLYSNYSDEIINEFKNGINAIRKAYVYIQRIDWLLSGDDGEESFLKRLKDDLITINNE